MNDITLELFKKRRIEELINARPSFTMPDVSAKPAEPFTFKDLEKLHKDVETMRINNEIRETQQNYLEALAKALVEKYGFELEVVTDFREELNSVVVYYKARGQKGIATE